MQRGHRAPAMIYVLFMFFGEKSADVGLKVASPARGLGEAAFGVGVLRRSALTRR